MFEEFVVNDTGRSEIAEFKGRLNLAVTQALKKMPEGRDKALFMTKIEEAVFFGTRAFASAEGNFSEIIKYEPPSTKTKNKVETKKKEK